MSFREPLPMECRMPSWMQGERFIYSDRFETEFVQTQKESIWTKIMNFFAQEKEQKPVKTRIDMPPVKQTGGISLFKPVLCDLIFLILYP